MYERIQCQSFIPVLIIVHFRQYVYPTVRVSDGTHARKIITENDVIATTNNLKDKTLRRQDKAIFAVSSYMSCPAAKGPL